MINKEVYKAIVLLSLSGCTMGKSTDYSLAVPYNIERQFIGDLYYQGEFHLFNHGIRLRDKRNSCITVVFPSDIQNGKAKDYEGMKVRIRGEIYRYTDIPVGEDPGSTALNWRFWDGSRVYNTCLHDFVILGRSIDRY